VFVENVAALLRRGFDVVHGDLAALGYDTSWICLRAKLPEFAITEAR
jgi:DNA (cytosine-5)-methyltransferase 1